MSEEPNRQSKYPQASVYVRSVPGLVERSELTGTRPGEIARRDLNRYYEVVRRSTPRFTVAEAWAIMDALNGGYSGDDLSPVMIWAEVADAIRLNQLDKKWSIDGPALVTRLQSLSYAELVAIADASERFWSQPERDTDDLLRELGLVEAENQS